MSALENFSLAIHIIKTCADIAQSWKSNFATLFLSELTKSALATWVLGLEASYWTQMKPIVWDNSDQLITAQYLTQPVQETPLKVRSRIIPFTPCICIYFTPGQQSIASRFRLEKTKTLPALSRTQAVRAKLVFRCIFVFPAQSRAIKTFYAIN